MVILSKIGFRERFAEKSSTDKITVFPFQNIKPIYNEYKEDFQNDVSQAAEKSIFRKSVWKARQ